MKIWMFLLTIPIVTVAYKKELEARESASKGVFHSPLGFL
jgi:hypothetical protein